MALTGSYTNDVQYLIEIGENAPLANNPNATDIAPTLDSKGRPVIGFGYDLLSNVKNFSTDLSFILTSTQIVALTNFLISHTTTPYTSSELATLQGLISIPTRADAIKLLQNSIATAESGLDALTSQLGIGTIPSSNERAALVDMYYQLSGGVGANGQGVSGYFKDSHGNFTKLSLALQNGNRAEAWFEIRYRSADNGADGLGVVARRYVDAQLFGLYTNPTSPSETDALQAYQMLNANWSAIMSYELQFGSDPYGSDSYGQGAVNPKNEIEEANVNYQLSGTANQVQTLDQVFYPAAQEEIQYLDGLYSSVLPHIEVNDFGTGAASDFNIRSVDIYAASPTDELVDAVMSDAPTAAEQDADASADHILLGSKTGDKTFVCVRVLAPGGGAECFAA